MFLTSGPSSGGTVGDTDTAADALLRVADYLSVHERERVDRALLTVLDALLAGHAAVRVVLRLCHADDAKVRHAHLRAVIRAAGEGNLHVAVVRENHILHLLRKCGRVVAAEGTESRTRAGNHVSCAGGRIALALLRLVNAQGVNDELHLFIDLVHILEADSGNLDTLTVGDVDGSGAVLLRNLNDAAQGLCIDHAARNTNSGSRLAAHLRVAEGILFQFL